MCMYWALHCSVPGSLLHCLVTLSYPNPQDPQRNRVYQWQEVELETGLTQLSFPLTTDPIQGSYKIVVQKSFSSHVEHSFSVEEYGKKRRCGLQVGLTALPFTVTSQFGISWEWHGGTKYLGNGVQRGWPRRCWVSEVVPHFICNLPELVFAHSALGSTGSDRLPRHGLWHQFQLTFSCFSVQQLVASSTRYGVKDDNILVTLFCLSHHLHQSCFSTCSPLFFLVSAKA